MAGGRCEIAASSGIKELNNKGALVLLVLLVIQIIVQLLKKLVTFYADPLPVPDPIPAVPDVSLILKAVDREGPDVNENRLLISL